MYSQCDIPSLVQIELILSCVSIVLGVLLLDEMKLKAGLSFNKSDLKVIGFTDLGKYTPETQKAELGDHALVIMFQPFQGKWVQSIGNNYRI